MQQRLDGKVAVVTGAGSGIGKAVAISLAEHGAAVVVNDPGASTPGRSADIVVNDIKRLGAKAAANYDSVATMKGGDEVIRAAIENFNRIDILVCCAGIFKPGKIDETTEEDWDRMMAVHAKGHFSCIKAAVPRMKEQRGGRIITFSSRAAFGPGGSPAYTAAKAAILGLTRCLAVELAEYGITVNSIIPSAVTPLFPAGKIAFGGLPAPNPAGPEMVAPFVTYLSSDESKVFNGQFFYAGGGDIAVYSHESPARILHKQGKWTLEELVELAPTTLGVS